MDKNFELRKEVTAVLHSSEMKAERNLPQNFSNHYDKMPYLSQIEEFVLKMFRSIKMHKVWLWLSMKHYFLWNFFRENLRYKNFFEFLMTCILLSF